jgi:hypothetical protein
MRNYLKRRLPLLSFRNTVYQVMLAGTIAHTGVNLLMLAT